jgi:integrase
VEWGYLEKHPLIGIKLFNVDNKVENYLNDDELETLLSVLRTHPNRPVCGIALYLLSTGCRLNEALKATWDQIDLGRRLWCIPATNSKSKKLRTVPLNDTALEVLEGFKVRKGFVFVNAKTGKPYTTIMKSWERIRCTAGLPLLRVHDLRHMYASFLVNAGRSLYEVQNILGHSDPKVTQRYAHLNTSSLLAAANSASVAIRQANRHR